MFRTLKVNSNSDNEVEVNQTPTPKTIKILYSMSCRCCAKCGTHIVLVDDDGEYSHISNIAHIQTLNKGPRQNTSMSLEEVRDIDNLVLVCVTCHKIIDDNPSKYTIKKLHEMKKAHEAFCYDVISDHVAGLTHVPIRKIAEKLRTMEKAKKEEDYKVIPPSEKVNKNEISEEIEKYLKIGMTKSRVIWDYLNDSPVPNEVESIRGAFLWAYDHFYIEGHRGDELFISLWDYISAYSNEAEQKAAGLVMVSYFFEICEAFRK